MSQPDITPIRSYEAPGFAVSPGDPYRDPDEIEGLTSLRLEIASDDQLRLVFGENPSEGGFFTNIPGKFAYIGYCFMGGGLFMDEDLSGTGCCLTRKTNPGTKWTYFDEPQESVTLKIQFSQVNKVYGVDLILQKDSLSVGHVSLSPAQRMDLQQTIHEYVDMNGDTNIEDMNNSTAPIVNSDGGISN